MQEIVELVVFGLIAVLVGTGVLWLVGWLIGLVGTLFMWLAGLLWLVLRYIIPVFVILGAIYFLFRLLQNRNSKGAEREPVVSGARPNTATAGNTGATESHHVAPAAAPVTTSQVQGLPYNPDGPAAATRAEPPEVEIVDPEPVRNDAEEDSSSEKKA